MAFAATVLSMIHEVHTEPPRIAMWFIGTRIQYLRVRATQEAIESAATAESESRTQLHWLSEWPSHIQAHGAEACWGEGVVSDEAERAFAMMQEAIAKARSLSETAVVSLSRRANTIASMAKRLEGREANADTEETIDLTPALAASQALDAAIVTSLRQHSSEVSQVTQRVSELLRESTGVERLATASRVATFNARLEAARLGGEGRVFVTIAETLGSLASNVSAQNARTAEVSTELSETLPALSRNVTELANRLGEHVSSLTHLLKQGQKLVEAAGRTSSPRHLATAQQLSAIREQTTGAMSDLQFSDRMSQVLDAIGRALDCVRHGSKGLDNAMRVEASLTAPEAMAAGGSMELF